jgi:hypothetical protein
LNDRANNLGLLGDGYHNENTVIIINFVGVARVWNKFTCELKIEREYLRSLMTIVLISNACICSMRVFVSVPCYSELALRGTSSRKPFPAKRACQILSGSMGEPYAQITLTKLLDAAFQSSCQNGKFHQTSGPGRLLLLNLPTLGVHLAKVHRIRRQPLSARSNSTTQNSCGIFHRLNVVICGKLSDSKDGVEFA